MGSSVLGADPFGSRMVERYPDLVPQGISAELIAERWDLSREELDEFALGSQLRAAQATAEARFDREIVPVPVTVDGKVRPLTVDEGIRADTTAERRAAL
jgi:acetyl-CoA acyltransferase